MNIIEGYVKRLRAAGIDIRVSRTATDVFRGSRLYKQGWKYEAVFLNADRRAWRSRKGMTQGECRLWLGALIELVEGGWLTPRVLD